MCILVNVYVCVCVYTHTHNYININIIQLRKNEIPSFAITWVDLEGILLSVISQTEKEKYCISLAEVKFLKQNRKVVARVAELGEIRKGW